MSDIVPNLHILDVTRQGRTLLVDLYGGWSNACGTLMLCFTDAAQCSHECAELRQWKIDNMPVTLVRQGDESFLRRTTLDDLDPPAAENDTARTPPVT